VARITPLATARNHRAQSSQLATLVNDFLGRYSVPSSRTLVELHLRNPAAFGGAPHGRLEATAWVEKV
jgi:hypothetical protein